MTLAEPPPEGGAPPLEGLRAQGGHYVLLRPQTQVVPQVMDVEVATPPPVGISRNLVNLVVSSESIETTTVTEPVVPFKTGSLSVRKDMMARLPAMHISDFKRNLRDLEKPCLKINELNLNSTDTSKLTLSESSLRVLNTPNVRLLNASMIEGLFNFDFNRRYFIYFFLFS
jgi:hypothetical protein